MNPVDLAAELSNLHQPWSPLTVATLNDYDVRIARGVGDFPRHSHPDTDEMFLVLKGSLTLHFDDGAVTLGPGQLHVVPRGVHHRPEAGEGAEFLMVEPSETINTGDNPGAHTQARRTL